MFKTGDSSDRRSANPLTCFALALALLAGSSAQRAGAQQTAAYTFVEAEAVPTGQVMADVDAYGGHYVSQTSAWQPMVIAPLPATGDSWVIWARIRDLNVQLKAVATDGSQNALNWEWDQPDDWTWVSLGRHSRTELGSKILLMRGPNAGSNPGLDAVVFANDDSFNPDTDITTPTLSHPQVNVTVNWEQPIARATSLSYGLNAFGGFDPTVTQNPVYEQNVAKMDPGLLRLHNWGVMNDSTTDPNGWIDTKNRCWDEAKIKKDLVGAYTYGPNLLINIPSWPSWMDQNGLLDPSQEGAFAQFCADLVRIVNKDAKLHVAYWEVTNERDGPYYGDFHDNGGALKDAAKPDHVADLISIYNQCAQAMKAVDPTIKVGGPAAARPDWLDFVGRFAAGTSANLDFFSFHAYGSGSKDDSDKYIFDRAAGFGADVAAIQTVLHQVSPARPIPIFFDEYNISWTWETRDPRMVNVKGAVFDALAIAGAVENGAAATAAWNERDGVYGKMDDSDNLRPGAALFTDLNDRMIGTVVKSTSRESDAVAAYAVRRADGHGVLLLINRSPFGQAVNIAGAGRHLRIVSEITDKPISGAQLAGSIVQIDPDSVIFLEGADGK